MDEGLQNNNKALFCDGVEFFGQTRFLACGGIFMKYAFGRSLIDLACRLGKQGRCFFCIAGRYGFRCFTDGGFNRRFSGKVAGASFSISFYAAN